MYIFRFLSELRVLRRRKSADGARSSLHTMAAMRIDFVLLADSTHPTLFLSPAFPSPRRRISLFSHPNIAISFPRKPVSCAASTVKQRKAFYPGEDKGFVEEMRFVAMKLHRKDQAAEGEKTAEADDKPLAKWEPSIQGYIKFLVDSKTVYQTLEGIVQEAPHVSYAQFRNTGLERVSALNKDIEWLKSQGHEIPEPTEAGLNYSAYLKELAEKDPPAFICHFYNIYFAHSAGGRMIGKQVADKILNGKELEFYKWDGELKELLAAVKEKLNKVAEDWTREQKNHCLQETEKSFKNSGKLLRLIVL